MTRILGIDPGLRITGYGLVSRAPASIDADLIEGGVIRLDASQSIELRLVQLDNELRTMIESLEPQVVAVEKLYAHYRHPRTAILMAHARGVILLAAKRKGIQVEHLPSTEVKKAVTGNGHASKQQIQAAVAQQCGLDEPPNPPDVADAIAIALTAARRL